MAIEDAPVVKVLDFDEAEAFNPNRPISGLIRTQLLHLHQAEYSVVPAESRTNININSLLTESQASDYIHKVTQLLHKHGKLQMDRKPPRGNGASTKKTDKSSKKSKNSARKADHKPRKRLG